MDISFDISKDELPVFLGEVDQHLQMLDNNLLLLRQDGSDAELIQTVFRSAHTIKGMAGMIGHHRITSVTHALENALDGVRKNSIQITLPLINLCLEAVDCLRALREEVATSTVSSIDIDDIVSALKQLVEGSQEEETARAVETEIGTTDFSSDAVKIHAKIDTNSMASAARAFQLMMALQDLGEIQSMHPSQDEIEKASAIGDFEAVLISGQPFEKISDALKRISGIDDISINGEMILVNGNSVLEKTKTKHNGAQPQVRKEAEASAQLRDKRSPDSTGRRASDLTLRMNIEHLDIFMNLVGELITDRNHLQQIRGQIAAETTLNAQLDELFETVTHLGRITDQLQEEVMSIRMLPIASMFNKFPRMVHDLSQKVDKLVNVVIHGEETEMDRSLIDEIYDPLIHIIRNSVDHGVELPVDRLALGKPEAGTITLTARHEQGRIIVTVEDDGRGINGEKLRTKALQKGLISAEEAAALTPDQCMDLMFLAGLSTVDQATEYSGRGVGLDIVRTNIQHVNGSIEVESHPGHGTKFVIGLPLTLAIVPSLLVSIERAAFAIPMIMITETVRLEEADIKYVDQKPVIVLRESVLALFHLSDVFKLPKSQEERKYLFAVVVQSGKHRVGLIVDSLIGEEEVVVKPLGEFVGEIPGISSASILGNGQVALILDVFNLFKLVGM
jgi:two-component system chemotaxis sensor kinase CheA